MGTSTALRRRAGRTARQLLSTADSGALAARLLRTGVFDPQWYAARAGCDPTPEVAVRHFLREGADNGCSPHPLVEPEHLLRRNGKRVWNLIGNRNPLVAYVTDKKLRRSGFHPMFDVIAYMDAHPDAVKHPEGPLGHYLHTGARRGFAPNPWYRADTSAEPAGLADWLRARHAQWSTRQAANGSPWTTSPPARSDRPPLPAASPGSPLVGVVVPAGVQRALLVETLEAVLAQSVGELDVVVVHAAADTDEILDLIGEAGNDRRVRTSAITDYTDAAALAWGVTQIAATWTAFALPSALWRKDHLAAVLARAEQACADAAYDVVERSEADEGEDAAEGAVLRRWARVATSYERARVRPYAFLGALVVRTSELAAVGGLDADLHRALGHDLELRLLDRGPVPLADRVGVVDELERREAALPDPRDRSGSDTTDLETWHQVVLDRHLSGWDTMPRRGETGVVSVIVPTHADSTMTARAVRRVTEAQLFAVATEPHTPEVEVLVLDNGCGWPDAARLDSLAVEFEGVRVLHEPVNRGFSLGNNVAVRHARGDVIVFLNNDTEVTTGWLAPLLDSLQDPSVLGVQSLLVYPSGSVQSAGIAFPYSGGVPHMLLQGFPVEDAAGLADAPLHAATAAALALRREDVIALRGFDTIFRNGMEDVDLGLRLRALRPGRLAVRPDSMVVHHESKSPGRFSSALANRRLLLDRYGDGLPADDGTLWAAAGYDVVGHEIRAHVSKDRRISVPQPVLARRPLVQVDEGPPRLRWALKNPAPASEAQNWGDTHFITSLSAALRRLGQQVVVDHRDDFMRDTGRFDDVVLTLRGLTGYAPIHGQVSMLWLISHPERFTREEASSYDRVFAASKPWSQQMTTRWGLRIDPLLQATDPELFHPGRGRPDTGHPLLFVGSSRRVYRPMVRDALEQRLPLSLYGEGWDSFVGTGYVKATYLPNDQLGEFYRRAGVVLNDHWEDMREDGFLSNRLFDAAGSGARVVTDDVRGLEGLFGRSVQVATTPEQLAALVGGPDLDAIFGDDSERQAVAKRVHTEHSFDARARILLDAALDLRGLPGRSDRP